MFRGTQSGSVDGKGRLKLSAIVRRRLREAYREMAVFVTSLDGKCAKVFPIREWEDVENRLSGRAPEAAGLPEPSVRNRILFQANRFGAEERVDAQGRMRIPAALRQSADMRGPVRIQWQSNHMLVMSEARYQEAIEANRLTESDMVDAARVGL